MPYRPLRVVVTDWGNRRGRIFFPTGFAPSVGHGLSISIAFRSYMIQYSISPRPALPG